MVSSRVLLYGESYAMRYQTTTVPSFATLMAAPLRNETVSVNFASCATDLPVLSRCGEFLVRYGPSYCVLESSQMTLDQLRAVLASGELFHVAAGEVVWNALLATDNGAYDDVADVDDNDDNDSRTVANVADFAGLLLMAGVFVHGNGTVVSDMIAQPQRKDVAVDLRMLASRATAALAALAGVAAPLLAVGVAAQVLVFRASLAVSMQVQPVVGAREVLLLWGVRWAPGQLRAAVDERAGGAGGTSRDSSALAHVRVLQFSPTAVFDGVDNAALLTLCLCDLPRLEVLCLKGATGVAVATVQRLLTEHKALRFVCVVGAKRPFIGRELAAMKDDGVLKDKIIALSLGAVANSDARERAKRAAYDWLMASAARRYSTSLPPLAAPAAGASVGTTALPPQHVVFRPFAGPVVALTDVEHQFSLDAGARRSFWDRVLAFIESGGSSSDFPLPLDVVNASPFVAKDSEKKKFVEYRTLLLDKAGAALVEMSLWCATGFVLAVNWCTAGDIQVTWRENSMLQPLLALFARYYAEWTGNDWSTGRVEEHTDKPV